MTAQGEDPEEQDNTEVLVKEQPTDPTLKPMWQLADKPDTQFVMINKVLH